MHENRFLQKHQALLLCGCLEAEADADRFLKDRTSLRKHHSLLLCSCVETEADAIGRFSLLGSCLLTGALCLLEEMPLCLAGRASFLGAMLLARLGRCRAAMRSLLRAMCSARSRSYADISSTFCIIQKPSPCMTGLIRKNVHYIYSCIIMLAG